MVEKKKVHRVLIVFSKFNSFLGEKLVEATKKALTENKILTEEIKELSSQFVNEKNINIQLRSELDSNMTGLNDI